MSVTNSGTYLATSSEKGTLIRIWSTQDGKLLQEVRRGTDKAEIYSIVFDKINKWIAVSSDKHTIHLFAVDLKRDGIPLKDENEDDQAPPEGAGGNKEEHKNKSRFGILGKLLPGSSYINSEWSYAKFAIQDSKSVCAFSDDSKSLIVVSYDGNYYEVDIQKGDCKEKRKESLLAIEDK